VLRRRTHIALRLALAAFAAAPAFAGDVVVGGRTELWYDDNVLGTDGGEISDGELLISPTVELTERWGDVDGSLLLKPTYELFFDQQRLRGFNYQADARLTWKPSQRTQFALTDGFQRNRSLRLLTLTPQGGTPAEFGARDRFSRNVAQIQGQHRLTQLDTLRFGGAYSLWRFSDSRRVDQDTYSANLGYDHLVTRTLSLGGSTSWSRLSFDDPQTGSRRDTDYFNVSFAMNYEPRDTFFIRASAGPTYVRQPRFSVRSRRLDPMLARGLFSGPSVLVPGVSQPIPGDVVRVPPAAPAVPGGPFPCPLLTTTNEYILEGCNVSGFATVSRASSQIVFDALALSWFDPLPFQGSKPDRDSFTYFADISTERRWENATLTLAYTRDEGSSSSVGFSSIADAVELRGSYAPLRELSLYAALVWEDRVETRTGGQTVTILGLAPANGGPQVLNLVPVALRSLNFGSLDESVQSITTYVSAQYRLSKRARLDAAFQWRNQNASATAFFNDYERMQLMLGVTVELDPFRW
jgi:hypothetical protein